MLNFCHFSQVYFFCGRVLKGRKSVREKVCFIAHESGRLRQKIIGGVMNTKWKRAIIMAACVALGSQVSVAVLADGFIIAMAVVVLGVLMYEYNLLEPFYAGLLISFVSPVFRGIVLFLRSDIVSVSDRCLWAWTWIYPEIGFYITYGLCFAIFYKNGRRKRNLKNYFFCMVLCDFLSNMAEMFFRYGGHLASSDDITGLALVALGRSALICCLLLGFELYKSLLAREEHEERYKKLMIMVSVFRSEIYFMNKNMVEIEDIMKKAFKMYRTMNEGEYPLAMKEMSLDIAKDVHEIKKDYIRVIKGLQENFLSDMDVNKMSIKDIVSILEQDIKEQIQERKVRIRFVTAVRANFVVEEHFGLMSVLRNLVLNSIDAIGDRPQGGIIQLIVKELPEKEAYEINIEDDGSGIRKSDLETIFDAGYSTKFDDETGAINRGVGLTLVRDLVRDKFHGDVQVESKEGFYTIFKIQIPKGSVEGEGR